jgi:hypothetical protein
MSEVSRNKPTHCSASAGATPAYISKKTGRYIALRTSVGHRSTIVTLELRRATAEPHSAP